MFKNVFKTMKISKYANLKISTVRSNFKLVPFQGVSKVMNFQFSQRGSKEWMQRHTKDHFVKKSKILDYRSRASFKLIEINQKYKILRPGIKVLDLGSSPGGWSQVIAEKVKSNEKSPSVVAIDLLKMDPIGGVSFIQGDLTKKKSNEIILEKNSWEKFDLICSDMCPEFTGNKFSDHTNLISLNEKTFHYAFSVLKRNGNLIVKTFEGTLQKKLQENVKKYFTKINKFKPASSRSESSELYLVCTGYLENEELKKEAQEIKKMSNEEYFEQEKNEALKDYRLAKLNDLTLLEELDKLRNEIINKFEIDPDKIKYDEKEEEQLRKEIEDENYNLHVELYGEAYKPTKARTISEHTQEFVREVEEDREKFKKMIEKDEVDPYELEEFYKADQQYEYMKERAEAELKDLDFLQRKMEALSNKINEEDMEEILRKDSEENEKLKKFKKWEKMLEEINAQERFMQESQRSEEASPERSFETSDNEDRKIMEGLQNLKKKLKKKVDKQSKYMDEDVFWKQKNRNI